MIYLVIQSGRTFYCNIHLRNLGKTGLQTEEVNSRKHWPKTPGSETTIEIKSDPDPDLI